MMGSGSWLGRQSWNVTSAEFAATSKSALAYAKHSTPHSFWIRIEQPILRLARAAVVETTVR